MPCMYESLECSINPRCFVPLVLSMFALKKFNGLNILSVLILILRSWNQGSKELVVLF
jgi:hypothetical protein